MDRHVLYLYASCIEHTNSVMKESNWHCVLEATNWGISSAEAITMFFTYGRFW